MLSKQEILNTLKENKEYLQKHFHLTKIGVFGSFARDEQRSDSDVDILIEIEDNTKNIFDLKWELREYFKSKFNREVDLCSEKYIKPYAKSYILRDAIYV